MVIPRRMRLCLVTEFFYPDLSGGTAITTSELARKLADKFDIDVEVVTGTHTYQVSQGKLAKAENWDGINIFRAGAPDWNRKGVRLRSLANVLLAFSAFAKLMRRPRYDVVMVTTAPPFLPIAASLLKRFKGTPYAYVIFDLEPDRIVSLNTLGPNSPAVKLLEKLQTKWLHRATRVVSIGRCMTDRLKSRYGVTDATVRTVPWGAELASNEPIAEHATRPKLSLLYSGNLGRYHDFDSLLDCAKAIEAEGGVEFVIVGRGAKRDHIAARIQAEQIGNVMLKDFVPAEEYAVLLRKADVCLVTMEKGIEGTCVPSKVYSILAAGRPVLAVVNPECETGKTISEFDCGLTVAQQDGPALLHAIRTLRDHPERLAAMAENSRIAFKTRFSLDRVACDIYNVLLECSGGGKEFVSTTAVVQVGEDAIPLFDLAAVPGREETKV